LPNGIRTVRTARRYRSRRLNTNGDQTLVPAALLIPCWRSKPSEVAAISTSLKLPQEQTIAVHVSGYQYPPDQPQRSQARRFRDRRSHILEKRSRRKPPPG
jgi:hypothetical protein